MSDVSTDNRGVKVVGHLILDRRYRIRTGERCWVKLLESCRTEPHPGVVIVSGIAGTGGSGWIRAVTSIRFFSRTGFRPVRHRFFIKVKGKQRAVVGVVLLSFVPAGGLDRHYRYQPWAPPVLTSDLKQPCSLAVSARSISSTACCV